MENDNYYPLTSAAISKRNPGSAEKRERAVNLWRGLRLQPDWLKRKRSGSIALFFPAGKLQV